ncbi:conserved hypothetical protein [Theileria equi strain WA]|uniref:Uncharacterized protein n=1 Tax=Theileria equi strain WA TaxID=1537102 RepID=L1LD60_THEEQ|nr:conserved hypothetical protein [Theileria equi strain WA]EKX73190.1 conserved hypothetical protein [Theileria equi strain WA]|eukprot:XP_004832642.1 conserved hypothetical protein [Theileria equi strain WA]
MLQIGTKVIKRTLFINPAASKLLSRTPWNHHSMRFKQDFKFGAYEFEQPENPWEDRSYRNIKISRATGWPLLLAPNSTHPMWQPHLSDDNTVMPRDGYGCLASFPPEVSTRITHTYRLPPQFYPFLKRLGDDTPELKPYMDKLMTGSFTNHDYEEMFYKFAKPLKIYRKLIPKPYRTVEEQGKEDEVTWESSWLSYRQKVAADYNMSAEMRQFLIGMLIGIYFAYLWLQMHKQYRLDMRLYYHEAPEHKYFWVKPRGDLV